MLMLIGKRNDLDDLYDNFNTSHVNVNQTVIQARQLGLFNFNTSHVNVNPTLTGLYR